MGSSSRPGATATTAVDLAEFVVRGVHASGTTPMAPPPSRRDLRLEPVTGTRTLTLSMGGAGGMGGMAFTIDGKQYDEGRVDTEVPHD